MATKELITLAEFKPDMHILDVDCGIGGSTRRLSHEMGCRVTGIDLSNEYVAAELFRNAITSAGFDIKV